MRVARVSEIVGATKRRGTTVLPIAAVCADGVADDDGLFASTAIASAAIIDKQTKASLACISVDPLLMRGLEAQLIITLRKLFFL
jgi:hypothetical protein